ncbi:MAG: Galactose-1-phosphate uridylyltransferase [Candidatus Giovannonibacteria bacterium GW2011_GWA2_44_13b]|uniref:Galactose-1-phosphate uridylyltransferase n=2 Tax=Candidatus Giovannoniibacteriota TaxID=1752738 RepID=A0A0G1H3Q0_9BACT|nr:MAG: Galactose-1-phosphate uridylyltransferase [Candidatus Nomurabacteria bacterium GW2011_GWA1_40_8]KKT41415.1 MAG: Galactose-1-phosphate uridylyltransferase [Candidatus Giovannonibacteria bacterium GW2011_GWA2_44_13b]OGF82683.1 MAG: hypothetical protein A2924_00770 [Candidatus Giovannonibacteria bacterium RIFCSPLOWO2_01_FULL_44_16]
MGKNLIEFRKDLVSGDWVLISSTFQKKPVFFTRADTRPLPKSKCPFEDPQKAGHNEILMWLPRYGKNDFKNWWLQVLKNRFPVIDTNKVCSPIYKKDNFEFTPGNGFQELVIMRDHQKPFGIMNKEEIELVLEAYTIRYHALCLEPCVEYILILHNSGLRAGASVPHPHSQIFAIPIIPPDVSRSLVGSANYYRKNKRCVHCDMLKWETNKKDRIIYQNDSFMALAPYASKAAYEVRIFPKKHEARFEMIDRKQKSDLAEAMRKVFGRIYRNLKNPDYNFFIHTAPPKESGKSHYHWHIEILPRVAVWGGLELGAGIEVVKISPEETAKLLRK